MHSPYLTSGQTFSTRMLRPLLAATEAGVLAAVHYNPSSTGQSNLGGVALPQPLPPGDLSITTNASCRPDHTGSMACPTPSPLGNGLAIPLR